MNWNTIQTEAINPATVHIDTLSTIDMVTLINAEDKKVADAVEAELPHIAQAVDIIAAQMKKGGRLVYSGCGTSGRLGVLDAVECPPTYSTEPEQVVGLIAGGEEAMFLAVEGAEDSAGLGAEDLKKIGFGGDVCTIEVFRPDYYKLSNEENIKKAAEVTRAHVETYC